MSAASSGILPVGAAKNILWVDTYYYCTPYTISNMSYNAANMSDNSIWKSEKVKIPYLDVLLEFQFVRFSELEFRVTCIRNPSFPEMAPDYGYKLQFHCSISIFDDDPKVFEMLGGQMIVFETFRLNASYRQCFPPGYVYKQFELKILVKIFEYDILPTYIYLRQEDDFYEIKQKFAHSELVLQDMGYILKCPTVQGIFTGRQDYDFAALKSNFIKRTAAFSKEIADYMRAKEDGNQLPLIDLSRILNNILHGEYASISNEDLIKVYFEAHRVGLHFLVDLSRDCILRRIGDKQFVIDALQAADRVNDEILFDRAAQNFQIWEKEILNSEKWLEMLKYSNVHCRFIMYSIKRFLKKESRSRAETGEALESNSFKIF